MEWLKNLSPRDKVLVIGGGALVLLFLFRTLTGNKTPDAGASIDQSQATAQAEQRFEQNMTQALQQNNQALQEALTTQTQGLLQMMSGFQERQTKTFSDLETTLQTASTTQNNSIANLLSQMSKPINYAAPASTPAAPRPSNPTPQVNKVVYGNSIDLASAKNVLGTSGYTYINTEGMDTNQLKLNSQAIVVGGSAAGGGVGDINLNGATRLAGTDRQGTASAIANYALNH